MAVLLLLDPGERHTATKVRSLEDDVVGALHGTGYHQLHQLRVRVDSGKVHLSGPLPSYYLKQRAHHAVLGVPGVVAIVDEIDIVN